MNKIELINFFHNIVLNDMDGDKLSYDDIMNFLIGAISNTVTNKAINGVNDGNLEFDNMVDFINEQMVTVMHLIPKQFQKELDVYFATHFSQGTVTTKDNVVPFTRTLN